jgi:antitoxin component of MazEF toxin-antitoxin module
MSEKYKIKSKITKSGGSLYLLIPFYLIDKYRLQHNDEVYIEESKGRLIITKKK